MPSKQGSDAVRWELREGVAVVHLDDGKANALSPQVIGALNAALDAAEKQAGAVVVAGRPGRFCAGFDLGIMRQGGAAMASLVGSGAELALRLYELPQPIVLAVTGHALAMGAVLCLSADLRIGTAGEFKLGLNEVAIGLTLPVFAVELARERLSPRHLARATSGAEIYDPSGAVEAGFLDRVAPPERLLEEAVTAAGVLARLDGGAHRATKRRVRAGAIERIRRSLSEPAAFDVRAS